MIRHEKLDHEIVWNQGGHLSEVAKSALADGQDSILPLDAMTHFSRCEDCSRSVGEAALLSAELSAAFALAPPLSLPWIPIAAAMVVAAASAVPMVVTARSWLSTAGWLFTRSVPIASHAFFKLAVHGLGPTFYFACTFLLLAMGLAVARLMPRGAVQ
jgi:hypothetical protein